MDQADLFFRYGVALAIGAIVGLQREFVIQESPRKSFAGIRTFMLLALVGCGATHISSELSSQFPFVAMTVAVGALLVIAYYFNQLSNKSGMTTEMAALATFVAGGISYSGHTALAVAFGVTTMSLLAFKGEMHRFVRRHISRDDIIATVKFAIITAIVLPVIPNARYGPEPFDIFNPQKIWLRVVLISGISYLGYIMVKSLGAKRGVGLTGLLGGLASSTAVTLSFAGRSREAPELARAFALAIVSAWTVMFARVLVVVAIVNGALFRALWLPLGTVMLVGAAVCAYLYFARRAGSSDGGAVTLANPFELRQAVYFGLILASVLALSRAGEHLFGDSGVFISSALAGLANTDAVALSIAELNQQGLALRVAAKAIVLGIVANSIGKGTLAMWLGTARLRTEILPAFVLLVVAGLAVAFLLVP